MCCRSLPGNIPLTQSLAHDDPSRLVKTILLLIRCSRRSSRLFIPAAGRSLQETKSRLVSIQLY